MEKVLNIWKFIGVMSNSAPFVRCSRIIQTGLLIELCYVCLSMPEDQEGSKGRSWNQVYRCQHGRMAWGMWLILSTCTLKVFQTCSLLIFRSSFSFSNMCFYNQIYCDFVWLSNLLSNCIWLDNCFSKPALKKKLNVYLYIAHLI